MIPFICIAILATASAFHIYWGIGGKIGLGVSLPQHEDGTLVFPQSSIAALAMGCVLLVALLCVLSYLGFISLPFPSHWIRNAVALLSFAFLARVLSWYKYAGMFKRVRTTRFAKYDTWLYSPLCLVLGLGLLYELFC